MCRGNIIPQAFDCLIPLTGHLVEVTIRVCIDSAGRTHNSDRESRDSHFEAVPAVVFNATMAASGKRAGNECDEYRAKASLSSAIHGTRHAGRAHLLRREHDRELGTAGQIPPSS
jgi:hypothetical protein